MVHSYFAGYLHLSGNKQALALDAVQKSDVIV
jgi:hypothetical protein